MVECYSAIRQLIDKWFIVILLNAKHQKFTCTCGFSSSKIRNWMKNLNKISCKKWTKCFHLSEIRNVPNRALHKYTKHRFICRFQTNQQEVFLHSWNCFLHCNQLSPVSLCCASSEVVLVCGSYLCTMWIVVRHRSQHDKAPLQTAVGFICRQPRVIKGNPT